MKKSRIFMTVMTAVLSSCMLAGCGSQNAEDGSLASKDTVVPPVPETTEAGAKKAPDEVDFSGVELVFAQDLATDETSNVVTDEVIKAWEDKTGAVIRFERHPTDYRVWLTTQFTANQGPDVYTGIIYDITSDYESDYLYNFKDLYDQESPYDPGQTWKDTLPVPILERMYLTDNDVPGYPTSTSVVRIFYNETLFKKEGLEAPATWEEFMEVCRKLKESGTVPFAFPNASKDDLSWLWFNNSVCSQLNDGLVSQLDESGNGYVELNEMVKGFDEGTLDFTSDSIKESFDLMKEFSQYWTSDYNGLDQKTAIEMFIRGEVAMVQAMSTQLAGIIENVGDSFDFGVMAIPAITKATSENAMEKSVILGGQPANIFAINKSCEADPKKLAAAIDFVQYMSSPEVQKRFMETVNRIPLSKSTQLTDRLSGFIITEEPLRVPYYTGVNNELRDFFCRGGQMYLEGTYDTDSFAQYVQESFASVFNTIKAEKGWGPDNNYGIGAQEE